MTSALIRFRSDKSTPAWRACAAPRDRRAVYSDLD